MIESKILIWDINEALWTITLKDGAKTWNFQDGGDFPHSIFLDFVRVNQDIDLSLFTNRQPVIHFVQVKTNYCLLV